MRTLTELEAAVTTRGPPGRCLALRDLASWPRGRALGRALAALEAARRDPDPGVAGLAGRLALPLRTRALGVALGAEDPEPDPYLRLAGATLREAPPADPAVVDALVSTLGPARDALREVAADLGEADPDVADALLALGVPLEEDAPPDPADLAAAARGDQGAAVAAAVACPDLAFEDAAPVLRDLLAREEPELRAHAIESLAAFPGGEAEELAVAALETAEVPDLRGRILRLLAARGDAAVPHALRALKLGPDALRVDALAALAACGYDAREKRKRFARMAESRDLRVAAGALVSLAIRSPREVTQGPVRRLIARGEEASLLVAARCLGYLPSPSSRLLLGRLAGVESPFVGLEAVRGLARHPHDEAVVQTLLDLLASPALACRDEVAASLLRPGNVGAVEVVEALRRYWEEERVARAWLLPGMAALGQGEVAPALARLAWDESRLLAEPALQGLLALPAAPPGVVLQWSSEQPEGWRRAGAALVLWGNGDPDALEDLVPMIRSTDPARRGAAARALRDAALLARREAHAPALAPLRAALAPDVAVDERSVYQPPPACEVDEELADLPLPRALLSSADLGAFVDVSARELARLYARAPALLREYRLTVLVGLLLVAQGIGLFLRGRGAPGLEAAPTLGQATLHAGEGLRVLATKGGRFAPDDGPARALREGSPALLLPGALAAGPGESVRVAAGPVDGNHATLEGPGEVHLGALEQPGPTDFHYRMRLEPRAGTLRLRATWGRPELTLDLGDGSLHLGRAVLDVRRAGPSEPATVAVYWGAARLRGPAGEVDLEPERRYIIAGGEVLEAGPLDGQGEGTRP